MKLPGFCLCDFMYLYRFRLHRNDLTAEGAENAEGENTEMNNSDATGFDINHSAIEIAIPTKSAFGD